MAANAAVVAMVVAMALVVVAGEAAATADNCDASRLAECLPAVVSRMAPTPGCCVKLRAQQGCFCEYEKDPDYVTYASGVQHMLTACVIAIPNCKV